MEAVHVSGGGIEGSKKLGKVECVWQARDLLLGEFKGVGDVCIYSSLLV
jgi:hypothetical protein